MEGRPRSLGSTGPHREHVSSWEGKGSAFPVAGLADWAGVSAGSPGAPSPRRTTPWGYRDQSQKEPHVWTPKPPSAACLKAEPTWTEFLKLRDSHVPLVWRRESPATQRKGRV